VAHHPAPHHPAEDRPPEDGRSGHADGRAGHERAAGGRRGLADPLPQVQDHVQDPPAPGANALARVRVGALGIN